MLTPSRKTSSSNLRTAESITCLRSAPDFKTRTFELMDEIVELKALNRQQSYLIEQLQQQLAKQTKNAQQILEAAGCNSKEQFMDRMRHRPAETNQLLQGSLEAYRQEMIDLKKAIGSLHFMESPTQKISLIKQGECVNADLAQLLQDNATLRDSNRKLHDDLLASIHKYEQLEAKIQLAIQHSHVSTQPEQKQYKRTASWVSDEEFSFGPGESPNAEVHSNEILCYQASIDGLMEENRRLKKVLHALYRAKHGQEVDAATAKEISIMERIVALNMEQADE